MDTPGLKYDTLLRSQEWRRPRWALDIPPRPKSRLSALSVAADGWFRLRGHFGLERWLTSTWRGDEPLIDLIREEGVDARDVIESRLRDLLAVDHSSFDLAGLFSAPAWNPADVTLDPRLRQRQIPGNWAWHILGLDDEPDMVARSLGISVARARYLSDTNFDSPEPWEEYLVSILSAVSWFVGELDPPCTLSNWLRNDVGPSLLRADAIACWDDASQDDIVWELGL